MHHWSTRVRTLVITAKPREQERAKTAQASRPLPDFVFALALWTVLATGWIATKVFERVPHLEDEVALLFQARTYAAGHLLAPAPALPAFFWIPFVVVHQGHWFGKYPPGYSLVLALGVLLHAPWLVNPLAAGLAVVLTAKLGQQLFDMTTGVLAAVLLALSPFVLLQAGTFLMHVVCLDFVLLLLLAFEHFTRTGSPWSAAGAGVAFTGLWLSRPLTAVAVVVPCALWALWLARRPAWRVGVLVMGLISVLALVLLLGYNALTTGHPLVFGYQLWWPFDRVGFGPGIGVRGEHTLGQGWQNTKENLHALAHWLFGWPGALSVLPPLLGVAQAILQLAAGRRDRACAWDVVLASLTVCLIVAYMAYWVSGQMYGPRYYFESLGALALLSARGLLWLNALGMHLLERIGLGRRGRAYAALGILVLAGLISWNLLVFTPQQFRTYRNWYGVTSAGIQAVRAAGIHHAVVFVVAPKWTDYAPFFVENSPWLNGDVVYALDHGAADAQLLAYYPDRAAYRWQSGQLFLIRTADTPSLVPASRLMGQPAVPDRSVPSRESVAGWHAAPAGDESPRQTESHRLSGRTL